HAHPLLRAHRRQAPARRREEGSVRTAMTLDRSRGPGIGFARPPLSDPHPSSGSTEGRGWRPRFSLAGRAMKTKVPSPMFLALLAASVACGKKEAPPPPPPEVKVATVLQKDVPIFVEAIGQTRGSTEIEVRARVEGYLETINYKEGNFIRKGELMYTIDPRPFEASLAQAKAVQAQAEAQLARARQDVVRYEPLVAKNAISRQEYETAGQVQRAAEASLDAGKAAGKRAEIALSFTKVEAPAPGIAGKTEVYPGTLVGRGQSTLLTHISQVETIHVRVNIPERDYIELSRRAEQRGGKRPATTTPAFEMVLADRSLPPPKGKLGFVDPPVGAAARPH